MRESTPDSDKYVSFKPNSSVTYERRHTSLVDQIIAMLVRGMTAPEMQRFLAETQTLDLPVDQIVKLTNALKAQVGAWQCKPVQALYPMVYFDTLSVPVKEQGVVCCKTVHLALGVRSDGCCDMLGIWGGDNEGIAYWRQIWGELQSRGIKDILIAVTEDHSGLAEALAEVFATTMLQIGLLPRIRLARNHTVWRNRSDLSAAIESLCGAPNAQAALDQLQALEQGPLGQLFPEVPAAWRRDWEQLTDLFALPAELRAAICSTDQLDSVNARLQRILNTHGHFCIDDDVLGLLWLALLPMSADWTRPLSQWPAASTQLEMRYGDRVTGHVAHHEEQPAPLGEVKPKRVKLHQHVSIMS